MPAESRTDASPQAERAASRGRAKSWGWPLGLTLALAAMIAGSLTVLGLAVAHPDPPVAAHPLAAGAAAPRAAD